MRKPPASVDPEHGDRPVRIRAFVFDDPTVCAVTVVRVAGEYFAVMDKGNVWFRASRGLEPKRDDVIRWPPETVSRDGRVAYEKLTVTIPEGKRGSNG